MINTFEKNDFIRIREVKPKDNYVIYVEFDDGKKVLLSPTQEAYSLAFVGWRLFYCFLYMTQTMQIFSALGTLQRTFYSLPCYISEQESLET